MSKYTGKTVWITGASAGIGEALAIEFSKQQANVVLSARRKPELERVQKVCESHGAKTLTLPLDLAKIDTLDALAKQVVKHFGTIDVLINNGGISQRGFAKDTNIEVDKRIMDINFLGTVALTKAVLPQMLSQTSGQIAVVSSLVGKFGTPLRTSYAASKHALHGYFDALRAELHNDRIGVTIICPGFVHTDVSVNALTGDGTPNSVMDNATYKGISPEYLAKKAVKALTREKFEVYIGGTETFGVHIKRFFPTRFAKMLPKLKVS